MTTDPGRWVPEEPTDKMTAIGQRHRYDSAWSIGAIYQAMLAAAPPAPASEEVREAARLMVRYWSDKDDEPTDADIALVQAMAAALSPPSPAPAQTAIASTAAEARLARLLRILRPLKWTDVGVLATEDAGTKAALEELAYFLFSDGIDTALSGQCDCERSHNGVGIAGRQCDCSAGAYPAPAQTEADGAVTSDGNLKWLASELRLAADRHVVPPRHVSLEAASAIDALKAQVAEERRVTIDALERADNIAAQLGVTEADRARLTSEVAGLREDVKRAAEDERDRLFLHAAEHRLFRGADTAQMWLSDRGAMLPADRSRLRAAKEDEA